MVLRRSGASKMSQPSKTPKIFWRIEPSYSAWKSDACARFSKASSDKSQPNNSINSKRQIIAVGSLLGLLLWRSPGLQPFSSRQAHGPSAARDLPRLAIDTNAFDQDGLVAHWRGNFAAACVASTAVRAADHRTRAALTKWAESASRAERDEQSRRHCGIYSRRVSIRAMQVLAFRPMQRFPPLMRQIAAHGCDASVLSNLRPRRT